MPNIPTIGRTSTQSTEKATSPPTGKIQRSSELVIIEQAIINQVLDESKLDMTRNARKRTELPGTSKLRFSTWCQLNFIKSFFENLFKRPLELQYSRPLPPPPPPGGLPPSSSNRTTATQRTNEPRPSLRVPRIRKEQSTNENRKKYDYTNPCCKITCCECLPACAPDTCCGKIHKTRCRAAMFWILIIFFGLSVLILVISMSLANT